ncbi:hypothetical protein F4861DRAFT_385613 [Xylaria intraflava]|nr:hypothetical protein F4861DRAFT_385613 [Xylaria intraflava]
MEAESFTMLVLGIMSPCVRTALLECGKKSRRSSLYDAPLASSSVGAGLIEVRKFRRFRYLSNFLNDSPDFATNSLFGGQIIFFQTVFRVSLCLTSSMTITPRRGFGKLVMVNGWGRDVGVLLGKTHTSFFLSFANARAALGNYLPPSPSPTSRAQNLTGASEPGGP